MPQDSPLNLGDLIAAFRERTGDSYGTIASRTSLARPTIHKLATQPLKSMPRPGTIRDLARAMNLSERTVRDAALTSVGLPVESDRSVSDAIHKLDENAYEEIQHLLSRLDPAQYTAVLSLLRSMVPVEDQ